MTQSVARGSSVRKKKAKVGKVSASKTGAKKKVAKKVTKKSTTKAGKKGPVTYKGPRPGDAIPAFSLAATSGRTVSERDLVGKITVLYFYPKDNTPGCTLEGHDFKARHSDFQRAGVQIFGVSRDSLKSHESFKAKCGFPFELLSDEKETLGKLFDVIQMKSLYGRSFVGIERSTFVIDNAGVLRREWRKVKVDGHAAEVLAYIRGGMA